MTNLADHSNPYQSPTTPTHSTDQSRLRLVPVIVGWAVDIGGSMILSMVLGGILAFQALARNPRITPAEFVKLASDQPMWFWLTSIGLGLLCTAVGGYVTAWLARNAVWKHVLAMSMLSVASGVLTLLVNMAMGVPSPGWHFAIGLTAIPAAFLARISHNPNRKRLPLLA